MDNLLFALSGSITVAVRTMDAKGLQLVITVTPQQINLMSSRPFSPLLIRPWDNTLVSSKFSQWLLKYCAFETGLVRMISLLLCICIVLQLVEVANVSAVNDFMMDFTIAELSAMRQSINLRRNYVDVVTFRHKHVRVIRLLKSEHCYINELKV